ncbi:MAG: energy transducer TonB [Bacteroidales bacterium]|jgi:protein TonB|nr:energy transducer TonB [Bacteroidales bacterium]MBR6175187.1 energy transducer TonB [Bacteroidales bacterium]
MVTKKTDKGNLENKRGLFALVGFALVLGLVYAGFELFASEDRAPAFELVDDDFITVVDDDVLATDQTPPPPPPQQPQQQEVIFRLVDDNVHVDMDISFDVDIMPDDVIPEVDEQDVELVDEAPIEEPPELWTDEMPEYPGGPEALNAFLTREIQYPEVARTNGITGTVLIEFIVEKDGRVSNAKVKVPLFPECDKEAVRGVMAMPKWKPGKKNGKPVRCFYQVPVTYRQ